MTLPRPRIRQVNRADLEPLTRGFASGSIAQLTRYSFPYSQVAALVEHDSIKRTHNRHRFAIMVGDELVGLCTLRPPLFSGMELTIGIFDARYQGRGIGTFAVRQVCAFGFEKLKLHRIELGVYPDNLRAQRCYVGCGFRREALLRRFIYNDGSYRDIVWMSLLRKEWRERQRALASRSYSSVGGRR